MNEHAKYFDSGEHALHVHDHVIHREGHVYCGDCLYDHTPEFNAGLESGMQIDWGGLFNFFDQRRGVAAGVVVFALFCVVHAGRTHSGHDRRIIQQREGLISQSHHRQTPPSEKRTVSVPPTAAQ